MIELDALRARAEALHLHGLVAHAVCQSARDA